LRALVTLNERDRELLRLIAWEGLEHGQVADVLGINPRLLSLRLHRARRRFVQALAHDESAESRSDTKSPTEVF
jgi:DNA-directed RNA polymerase specialized sigma24 family protein